MFEESGLRVPGAHARAIFMATWLLSLFPSAPLAQPSELLPGATPILAPSFKGSAIGAIGASPREEQSATKRITLGMTLREVQEIGWIYILTIDPEDSFSGENRYEKTYLDENKIQAWMRFRNDIQFPGEGSVDFTVYLERGKVVSITKDLPAKVKPDDRKLCAVNNFGKFLEAFAEDKSLQRRFTKFPLRHTIDVPMRESIFTYKTIEQIERQFGPGLAFSNWEERLKWNLVVSVYKYDPNSKLWSSLDNVFLNPTAIQDKNSYIVQKTIHPNDDGNGYHFYYKFRHERGCWRLVEMSDPST